MLSMMRTLYIGALLMALLMVITVAATEEPEVVSEEAVEVVGTTNDEPSSPTSSSSASSASTNYEPYIPETEFIEIEDILEEDHIVYDTNAEDVADGDATTVTRIKKSHRGRRSDAPVGNWVFGDSASADAEFFAETDKIAREWKKKNAEKARKEKQEQQQANTDDDDENVDVSSGDDDKKKQKSSGSGKKKEWYDPQDNSPEARRWRRQQRKEKMNGKTSSGSNGKNERPAGLSKATHSTRRTLLSSPTNTLTEKVKALLKDIKDLRRNARSHLRGTLTNNYGLQIDNLRAALVRASEEHDDLQRNKTTVQSAAAEAEKLFAKYNLPLVMLDEGVIAAINEDVKMLNVDAKSLDTDLKKAASSSGFARENNLYKKLKKKDEQAKKKQKESDKKGEETPSTTVEEKDSSSSAISQPTTAEYETLRANLEAEATESLLQLSSIMAHHTQMHLNIMEAATNPLKNIAKEFKQLESQLNSQMNMNDESTTAKRKELKTLKKRSKDLGVLKKEVTDLEKYISGKIRRKLPSTLENLVPALEWVMRIRRASQFETNMDSGDGASHEANRVELLAYDIIQQTPLQSITNFFGLLPNEAIKVCLCAIIPFGLYATGIHPLFMVGYYFFYGGVFDAKTKRLTKFFALPKTKFREIKFVIVTMMLETRGGHFIASIFCTMFGLRYGTSLLIGGSALLNRMRYGHSYYNASAMFDESSVFWPWYVFGTPLQHLATVAVVLTIQVMLVLLVARPPQYKHILDVVRISKGRKLGSVAAAAAAAAASSADASKKVA